MGSGLMGQPLIIGVLCDDKQLGPHHFHCAGDKYVRAVVDAMDAIPLQIPVLAADLKIEALLARLDGLLLPGSYSNIDPIHYGQDNEEQEPLRDPARDDSAFALIKGAVAMGLPVFAICRGFQEVNVALGGTLYQRVQTEQAMQDHREDGDIPLEQQYADVHKVALAAGGKLAAAAGKPSVMVNSLHQQGVRQLSTQLQVEATADDGLIEAYSMAGDQQFLLGVQWHPEWKVLDNPFNLTLFHLFQQACQSYSSKA